SGPKILILGEPTRFPAFARLGDWFMAPSRAAAYPHHAQECLRLADLMTSPEHRVRFHSLGFPRSRPGSGSKRLRGLRPSRTYFGSPPREVAAILAVRPV